MNKKYLAASAALIAIIVLVLGSVAYFSKTGTSKSVVKSSDLKIELKMMEYIDDVPQEVEGETSVMPGEYLHRMALVKNVGREDAWVRIKAVDLGLIELVEINEADWTEKDGYWYYNKELASGESTEPLFYGIRASEEAGNESAGEELTLNIDAQATQVKHNGSTALEAKGWPEA